MTSGVRKLITAAVILACSGAVAQDRGDDFLLRYDLALENLAAAVAALPEDTFTAFEEIEAASGALRTLSLDSENGGLVSAMERVLERARTAIENKSGADLAVQTAVLTGGFQRLVFESAMRAATEGDLELARGRLLALAADLEFGVAATSSLRTESDTPVALRLRFEQGLAEALPATLETARDALATDKEQAYRTLAVAYGRSLLIQDSPRADAALNGTFVEAIQALVAENQEVLNAQVVLLESQLGTLIEATEAALARPQSATAAPAPSTTELTPPPTTATATAAATETSQEGAEPEQAQAAAILATPTAEQEQDVTAATAAAPSTAEAVAPAAAGSVPQSSSPPAEATDPVTEAGQPAAVAAPDQLRALALEEVQQALTRSGLTGNDRIALAERYLQAGFTGTDDVLDYLYTLSAQAIVAVEVGDQDTARARIREFHSTFGSYLRPVVAPRDAQFEQTTERLLSRLGGALALRLQDTVVLAGHVDAIRAVMAGEQPGQSHQGMVQTTLVWSGTIRLLVVVFFGLLAFVPLYLLNLAFGGGNRNWQLVGVALFLLLLPIIFEGISFLGSLIASLTGIATLELLSSYSIFQNTISQVVWASITAVAIVFAIAGLYGICAQFGLLGRRRPAPATAEPITQTQARGTVTDITDETLVDWDEEF